MRWYPYLSKADTDSLFSNLKRDNARVVISKVNRGGVRYFTHLSNPGSLIELLKMTPSHLLAYHEVILGERPQKMRFDIDLSLERAAELGMDCRKLIEHGEEICHRLIDSIITTIDQLTGRSLELMKDILLTESHGQNKFSRHIILCTTGIDGYKEARHLFGLITAPFAEWVRTGIIDSGIYSSTKSFRLLGCIKMVGDSRVKKLTRTYTYKDVEYVYSPRHDNPDVANYILLTSTMIGNVDGCEIVPIVLPIKEYPQLRVGEKTVDYVITVVNREFPGDYEFNDVKNNSVCFNRLRPSYCDICRRVHDKMGMLVMVQTKRLVHYCGRSSGIGQVLEGDLGDEYAPYAPDPEDEEDVGMLLRTPLVTEVISEDMVHNSVSVSVSVSNQVNPINPIDEASELRLAMTILKRRGLTNSKKNTPPREPIREVSDFSQLNTIGSVSVIPVPIPVKIETTSRLRRTYTTEAPLTPMKPGRILSSQPIPDNYDADD